MSRDRRDHPDMRDNAPGRIPESLIDAAIDGELDPEIQKEIGHALQYDPERRQQFHDTRDAINALRIPVEMPDLSDRVLSRANRHRRFIPAKLRAQVRAGRLGMAAFLLCGLLTIAGLQRMYPRLTTIASQQTPVRDLEIAVEQDRNQLAQALNGEIETIRTSVAPVAGLFDRPIARPGNNEQRFGVELTATSYAHTAHDQFPRYSRASAGQPGLAVVTMMHAREIAQRDSADSIRYGLMQSDGSRYFIYASWSPQTPTNSSDRDTRPDRGYEVPDLP